MIALLFWPTCREIGIPAPVYLGYISLVHAWSKSYNQEDLRRSFYPLFNPRAGKSATIEVESTRDNMFTA